MKKGVMIGALILSLGLSFGAGTYVGEQRAEHQRQISLENRLSFELSNAAAGVERLKSSYSEEDVRYVTSKILSSFSISPDTELGSALHYLWNAFLFDAEHVSGREDDLIAALRDHDSAAIEKIAHSMRAGAEDTDEPE